MQENTELRLLLSQDDPELLFADGYDGAIIGISNCIGSPDVVVYSRSKCIEILIADGMDPEDAQEYFDYNTAGSYVGERTPIFITTIEDLL